MIEINIHNCRVQHFGTAPFRAINASRTNPNWPFWIVIGSDGINRIRFPDNPGATLLLRTDAEEVATYLNRSA